MAGAKGGISLATANDWLAIKRDGRCKITTFTSALVHKRSGG